MRQAVVGKEGRMDALELVQPCGIAQIEQRAVGLDDRGGQDVLVPPRR